MEMDNKKPHCPILDVDGVISGGKQFDLDITLPEDNRDVIYGVIKDCFKEPVRDAVVKLTEIVYDCGKEERKPIGHTFTDNALSTTFFISSFFLLIFNKFVYNFDFLSSKIFYSINEFT